VLSFACISTTKHFCVVKGPRSEARGPSVIYLYLSVAYSSLNSTKTTVTK